MRAGSGESGGAGQRRRELADNYAIERIERPPNISTNGRQGSGESGGTRQRRRELSNSYAINELRDRQASPKSTGDSEQFGQGSGESGGARQQPTDGSSK